MLVVPHRRHCLRHPCRCRLRRRRRSRCRRYRSCCRRTCRFHCRCCRPRSALVTAATALLLGVLFLGALRGVFLLRVVRPACSTDRTYAPSATDNPHQVVRAIKHCERGTGNRDSSPLEENCSSENSESPKSSDGGVGWRFRFPSF
jgi:hypothetical protein